MSNLLLQTDAHPYSPIAQSLTITCSLLHFMSLHVLLLHLQGTEVYMQSFGEANMWDDILAAVGNLRNRPAAEHLTRACVNEAISSLFGKFMDSRQAPTGPARLHYALSSSRCAM